MKIAAAVALLSLTSCGYMVPENRYAVYRADAIAQAKERCDDVACFKAVANAVYAKWMAKDRAAWDAVGNFQVAQQPAYKPAPLATVAGYRSAAPMVSTMDTCAMMSCPRQAAPPVQFIPYTSGGGNPSGYGLLAR